MSDLTDYARDPWDYVPGNEHHGPYVTTAWGRTVADCYTMSNPDAASVRNGGTSYPINHCGDEAEAHARLIAAAPELLALAAQYRDDLKRPPSDDSRGRRLEAVEAAIAKATGESQ